MKIDTSIKGIIETSVYIITGVYAWIEDKGISAYILTVLLVFMLMDMLLGVLKASVVKTLPNPTSKKAKRGILTKILMFMLPAVSGLIWGAFDVESALKIVNLQLSALMVAEGYSIIGNVYAIRTGEEIDEFDAGTYVVRKIANFIKKLLKKLLNEQDD